MNKRLYLLLPLFALFFSWCLTQCTPPNEATTGENEDMELDESTAVAASCSNRETVPATEAIPREKLWVTYVDEATTPNGWEVSLPTNANTYVMSKSVIQEIEKLTQTGGDLQIDTSRGFWLMLGLAPSDEPIAGSYDMNVNLYCYTTDGTQRVYEAFNTGNKLKEVSSKVAREQETLAKAFTEAYQARNETIPTSSGSRISIFPYGFKFPLCDLIEIADNLQEEKSLEAVFVIKPDEDNNSKYRPDIYLKVDYDDQIAPDASSGGSGYYDFTQPCPNSCPDY